ncbi:LysR family transcriptional regulator [Proteus myxofaciens]|uniref:Transcriptional regulator n=1 Tax=Proteus myxofaciens ATCC 19692 TaxID=1354337 RepID=A0A198GQY3_9GAMM|nr:LysR family transcriptional regulator [Proteus myxofaciens]OAT39478.1 transcriptional regulator [Proteus myxofaciens ATCC 19692]
MNNTNIESIDLNLMKVFEALFEEGSATRASIRLGLTQSAVSASLSKLRIIFHDPLFERTGRGLKPSPRANELAPVIESALSQCRLVVAYAAPKDNFEGRTITIGLSDDYEISIGKQLLDTINNALPGIHVIYRQTHSRIVQDMLLRHQIDLAITAGGMASHLIKMHRLGKGNYLCITDKQNPLPRSIKQYADYPHLLVSSGGFVGVVDEALKPLGLKRKIKISTTHFSAVPFLLLNNYLLTTIPSHAALAIANLTGMTLFEPPANMPSYELMIGNRIGGKHDDVIDKIKQLIIETCSTSEYLSLNI